MYTIKQKAYAKINLWLNIGSKTVDNYHCIESIMHEVSIYDEIEISYIKRGIYIQEDTNSIPINKNNTAYKAAELFFSKFNINDGIKIKIKKNIPIGAGLAGGSTDAATILKGLCAVYKKDINDAKILKIARQIGSDVPFFLKGGTCLVTGTGEKIEKIETDMVLVFIIIKPDFSILTKWAYDEFDRIGKKNDKCYNNLLKGIKIRDKKEVFLNMYNSFEEIIAMSKPDIFNIKKELELNGAIASMMSGSGSSVFGIFENNKKAETTAELLREKRANWHVLTAKSV